MDELRYNAIEAVCVVAVVLLLHYILGVLL